MQDEPDRPSPEATEDDAYAASPPFVTASSPAEHVAAPSTQKKQVCMGTKVAEANENAGSALRASGSLLVAAEPAAPSTAATRGRKRRANDEQDDALPQVSLAQTILAHVLCSDWDRRVQRGHD